VNYTKGQTIANSVIVPVSAGGVADLLIDRSIEIDCLTD
jgi:hypothetical protein